MPIAWKKVLIRLLLEQLDPHSEYIASEEFNEMNDPLMGSFDGIGVQFTIQKDTVLVVQPVIGCLSEKVGIRAGDRIVEADGKLIAGVGISNQEVMKALKGPRRTKVKLGVFRRGTPSLLNFDIVRDKIPTNSIDVAYMLNKTAAYVKISRFSAKTHKEFDAALSNLLALGMQSLVLDLRGNGGGVLQSAVDIADQFLTQGNNIVYTEGRMRPRQTYRSSRKGQFNKPTQGLVVLIDEFSASASEIIAGAIQDNDRGLIVGRRSFGKGLVQEQVQMNDGSAIRITVARYYTPSGRCIQSPYDDGTEKYYESFMNRFINAGADSLVHDSTPYYTSKGRKVYGGGGVFPDIYVPYDTAETSQWYLQLINHGLLYNYALDYTDANRSKLEKYKTPEYFVAKFKLSETDFQSFLSWCRENKVQPSQYELIKSKTMVINRLESYIARNVFGEKAFYPFYLKYDKTLQMALEELGKSR